MNTKIEARDLITVGTFTALYFIIMFSLGMLGFIPILFIIMPLYSHAICGIPFLLFLSKVDKFGMVSLMCILLGILMFATGHTFYVLLTAAICGLLADLIFKLGKYKSFKHTVLGYVLFCLWPVGAALPLWIARESYMEYIKNSMGEDYMIAIRDLTPTWVAFAMLGLSIAGAVLGAALGRKILKKHFLRAGIA